MPTNERENELEQYGAAVGIALSNGLHEEGLELAFTRGGGISVFENVSDSSLPVKAALDANAVGGADATLTFSRNADNQVTAISISSYEKDGAVKLNNSRGQLNSLDVDKDGDGRLDAKLQYERKNGAIQAIRVDENRDGEVDMLLIPTSTNQANDLTHGFNVDIGADGTVDGFAEFIRNENEQVKAIRFRRRTEI